MGLMKKLGKVLNKVKGVALPLLGQALIPIPGVGAAIGGMAAGASGSRRKR